MEKKRKPVREVLESLKAIRRRQVPGKKIEEFNQIVEKDDEYEREQEKKSGRSRKIARSPEAET